MESFGIVPGEKFAENYRQLVALRGIMLYASVCAADGAVPLRVLFRCALFQPTLASRDTEESHVE